MSDTPPPTPARDLRIAEWRPLARPQPFDHLAARDRDQPGAAAIIAPDLTATYRDLALHARRIATWLRAEGVRPGSVVCTQLPPHLTAFFLAALFHEAAIGATWPGPSLNADAVDLLIATRPVPGFPLERQRVVDDGLLRTIAALPPAAEPVPYPSFDAVCRLVFSSGTTGRPHAIGFTVAQIEARSRRAYRTWMPRTPFLSLIDVAAVTGILTAYTAISHGFPWAIGSATEDALALIDRLGIRAMKASPIQLGRLVTHLRAQGRRLPGTVELIESAGSTLPTVLADALRELSDAEVRNLYGSSESGTVAVGDTAGRPPEEMGRVLPHVTLEIVGPDGSPLPRGEIGEIRWRTPEQVAGYFRDPDATARSFRDGWFHPGDRGMLTEDGRLILSGRETDLVNVGGVKIDLAALDAIARDWPGVEDAAAFTLTTPLGLPEPALALRCGPTVDLPGLAAAVAQRFSGVRPALIYQVGTIPRNAYGKPVRHAILAAYLGERTAPRDR